jgi:hypothetical protein
LSYLDKAFFLNDKKRIMTNLEGTFTDISGTKNVHYSTGGKFQ